MNFPPYIAICGWPKSGKDEVAKALCNSPLLDARKVDDGLCLRLAAPHLFGCDHDDPFSQDGKLREYETVSGVKSVRWMLGELGTALENHFGEAFIPYAALNRAKSMAARNDGSCFVFPSVRKSQPWHYKESGAIVVEVRRPGVGDSGNDFDRWDARAVDTIIFNNRGLRDLHLAVDKMIAIIAHTGKPPSEVYA